MFSTLCITNEIGRWFSSENAQNCLFSEVLWNSLRTILFYWSNVWKDFFIRATFFFLKIASVWDAQLSKPWTALRNRFIFFLLPLELKSSLLFQLFVIITVASVSLTIRSQSAFCCGWRRQSLGCCCWEGGARWQRRPWRFAASWDETCLTGHLWHFWPAIFSQIMLQAGCYFCSEYWSILFTNRQSNSVSKAFSSCYMWNYLGMDWGWSVPRMQAWRAEPGSPSPAWQIKAFFHCYF